MADKAVEFVVTRTGSLYHLFVMSASGRLDRVDDPRTPAYNLITILQVIVDRKHTFFSVRLMD